MITVPVSVQMMMVRERHLFRRRVRPRGDVPVPSNVRPGRDALGAAAALAREPPPQRVARLRRLERVRDDDASRGALGLVQPVPAAAVGGREHPRGAGGVLVVPRAPAGVDEREREEALRAREKRRLSAELAAELERRSARSSSALSTSPTRNATEAPSGDACARTPEDSRAQKAPEPGSADWTTQSRSAATARARSRPRRTKRWGPWLGGR